MVVSVCRKAWPEESIKQMGMIESKVCFHEFLVPFYKHQAAIPPFVFKFAGFETWWGVLLEAQM